VEVPKEITIRSCAVLACRIPHGETASPGRSQHLEPWQRSISSVGPSVSVYYDIEIETFDIERYEMTFDIEIRYETRYRMFLNSISNALNLENIDIEGSNIRYRFSTISKNVRYRSKKDRYRLSTILKKHRYRSSKLRYRYIPISKKTLISKFKTSISLYPDIEDFSISINAPSIMFDICI
jgi:hypothetical protein